MDKSLLNSATIQLFLNSQNFDDMIKYADWRTADVFREILNKVLDSKNEPKKGKKSSPKDKKPPKPTKKSNKK